MSASVITMRSTLTPGSAGRPSGAGGAVASPRWFDGSQRAGGLGHRGIECAFGVVAAVAASLLISRASVVEMKPTDPVIELLRQARQAPRWHSKQGVNLVRRQLNSDLETRAGGIPKEISPETGVRQQSAERAFHVSLAHASARRQGLHHACLLGLSERVVLLRTSTCESARERGTAHYARPIDVKT
jgi:hypothetical protein